MPCNGMRTFLHMNRHTIFVIGECMIELQRETARLAYRFGGDTLNTAVYLSRLIDHTHYDIAYASALGTDSFSDEMCASWESEHINTQWVQRIPNKLPGMYLIETDASGERRFHYWRNDSAARYWLSGSESSQVCAAISDAAYIYLSGITLAILAAPQRKLLLQTLTECRRRGGKVIFDNNYRPLLWTSPEAAAECYREVLANTDIALLTLDDEDALFGAADTTAVIARTVALGVGEVVIKCGSKDCIVHADGTQISVPPQKVEKVIDTTAAGDSFGAAYIAARLSGKAPKEAAQAGHTLAACVIQHPGAIIPQEIMPN